MNLVAVGLGVVGALMTLLMVGNLLNGDGSMLANRILVVGVASALGVGTLAAAGIVSLARAFS